MCRYACQVSRLARAWQMIFTTMPQVALKLQPSWPFYFSFVLQFNWPGLVLFSLVGSYNLQKIWTGVKGWRSQKALQAEYRQQVHACFNDKAAVRNKYSY